jgi:hypothetical protein
MVSACNGEEERKNTKNCLRMDSSKKKKKVGFNLEAMKDRHNTMILDGWN